MGLEHLEKVSRAISEDYGIKVKFKGSEAFTDNRTIVLPELPPGEVTEREEDRIRGYCDHEVAHVKHSEDINKMSYYKSADKATQALTHIIEDIRCENLHSEKYAGARVNMQKLTETLIPETDLNHPLGKLLIEGRRQVCDYRLSAPDMSGELKKMYGDDVFKRIAACKSSKDSFDLANQLVHMPPPQPPSPEDEEDGEGEGGEGKEKKDKKDSKKGKGKKGDKQKGEGEEDGSSKGEGEEDGEGSGFGSGEGEGDGEGDGDGEDGEGTGSGEGEGDGEGKKGSSGKSEYGHSEKGKSGEAREGNANSCGFGGGSVKAIDTPFKDPMKGVVDEMKKKHEDALSSGRYMPYTTSEDTFKVMPEGNVSSSTDQYKRLIGRLGTFTSIKARVASMFTTRTSGHWELGKEEGRINNRALCGIVAERRDLFKKKHICNDVDTAIMFLVDCSGSMNSSGKIESAMATVAMFCEMLQTTKVHFEVLGFTTGGHVGDSMAYSKGYARIESLVTYVWKEFAEPLTAKIKRRIGNWHSLNMANNCDGESLMIAFQRLMKRKERRKIMFVLSDGQPCSAGSDRLGDKYLKEVCHNIETKSPVELIGIGYMNRSVSRYYKNHMFVDNPSELPRLMQKELKRILKVSAA